MSNEWEAGGRPTLYALAHQKVNAIFSSHYPEYVDPKADAAIRKKFSIKLDPVVVKPGNRR